MVDEMRAEEGEGRKERECGECGAADLLYMKPVAFGTDNISRANLCHCHLRIQDSSRPHKLTIFVPFSKPYLSSPWFGFLLREHTGAGLGCSFWPSQFLSPTFSTDPWTWTVTWTCLSVAITTPSSLIRTPTALEANYLDNKLPILK